MNDSSGDSGCDCDFCGAEVRGRVVKLVLAMGKQRTFCSDRCEHRWMVAELDRRYRYLNRIYLTGRGKARDIAKTALQTTLPP